MSPNEIPPEIYERAEILMDQFRHIEDDRELIARVLMEEARTAVPSRLGLTPIQSNVLTFVDQFQAKHGYTPAYREIAKAVGLSSKSGVHRVVHDLVSRGAVQMKPGQSRSISIVGRA